MKNISLLLIFCFQALLVAAQDTATIQPVKLTHWMSPEELLRKDEIGRGFVETDPPVAPVRNIAEFDRMQGALVRYPFGIPIALIKEMAESLTVTTIVATQSQKNTVINQYVSNGVDTSHCNFLMAPSDSYWTRDYGPWFVSDSSNQISIIDFPYNRPRLNDDEIPKKMAEMLGIPWYGMNLIHTGGNYMADGYGVASSTDLVWEENPTLSHEQVAQKVNDYLGNPVYQVRPDPNGTYIDHIDCWSKFLGPDKILVRKVPSTHSRYAAIEAAAAFWSATLCPYGYPYKVLRVNTPQNQPYTNSVILNNKVLMPFMNSVWDDSAKQVYQSALPGYEVIGFLGNPSTPWESTDALHCRVMGIADNGILFVHHLPLWGTQPCDQHYTISAKVIACSQTTVKSDSVLVWYKVNGGSFQPITMTPGAAGMYVAQIPMQPAGSIVKYYISAVDESERRETAPFIGPADPFVFTTGYTNLTAVPDTLWFNTVEDAINGKVSRIHNYMSAATNLLSVQQNNPLQPAWYVDSMTATTFPVVMNPADSFYVRVKMLIPTRLAPGSTFIVDSLHYTTTLGTRRIILMMNSDLLVGTPGEHDRPVLGFCYPNPLQTETVIPVTLTKPERVELAIFTLDGRMVNRLYTGTLTEGHHGFTWDGTAGTGGLLPSGIYLCKLTSGEAVEIKRVVVIR